MAEVLKKEIVQRITRNLLDIQILRLIKNQPMWGYKIKKQVEAEYGITLRHGTLYPTLNELERKGFLTSQRQLQSGRTRKVYETTQRGRDYAEAYTSVLKEQIQT